MAKLFSAWLSVSFFAIVDSLVEDNVAVDAFSDPHEAVEEKQAAEQHLTVGQGTGQMGRVDDIDAVDATSHQPAVVETENGPFVEQSFLYSIEFAVGIDKEAATVSVLLDDDAFDAVASRDPHLAVMVFGNGCHVDVLSPSFHGNGVAGIAPLVVDTEVGSGGNPNKMT